MEIALQARAGEQALEAARAWRAAKPTSLAPLRYQSQILLALNRVDDLVVIVVRFFDWFLALNL